MLEKASHKDNKPSHATYMRRRAVAGVAALTMLGVGAKGAAVTLGDIHDGRYGTDVPSAEDVQANPDKYVSYEVKGGDDLTKIAQKFTPENHDYRNNLQNFITQTGGEIVIQPGDTLMVPPTTETTKLPADETLAQKSDS